MKKGILLLSALLLVGVSACDFFGKKKEETKMTEEKPAAPTAMGDAPAAGQEQAMGDVVGQEVAMNTNPEAAPAPQGTEEHKTEGSTDASAAPAPTEASAQTVPADGVPAQEQSK